jgi:hypothetical protein
VVDMHDYLECCAEWVTWLEDWDQLVVSVGIPAILGSGDGCKSHMDASEVPLWMLRIAGAVMCERCKRDSRNFWFSLRLSAWNEWAGRF